MLSTRTLLAVLPLLAQSAAAQSLTQVFIPSSLPAYSKYLPNDLIGLSIEMDHWPDWAGGSVGTPNVYVNQVLQNLADRTGTPVPLRVGADSEDTGHIQSGIQVANATFPNATTLYPYPEATYIGIGTDFYTLSGNMPAGTPFTWGVNLRSLNQTETVAQVAKLYDAFYGSGAGFTANVSLNKIEIGNEVDRYTSSIAGWNIFEYISDWTAVTSEVIKTVDLEGDGKPTLQVAAYTDSTFLWDVVGTLGAGLMEIPAAKYISTFSYHVYFGFHAGVAGSIDTIPGALMGRAGVRGNGTRLSEFTSQAHAAGLEFVLGETNSYALHGTNGVSDAAEAAIWLIDYALQSASVGVANMFFHEGVGYAYNLIQPIPVNGTNASPTPHVQGAYYGAIAATEFIGSTANTRIAELAVNSSHISAYGAWENGTLARVMLSSSVPYTAASNGSRPYETINLGNFATGANVTLKRLTAAYTNSTSGILWGGQNFDGADGKASGAIVTDKLSGATLQLNSTEAVLLTFY